jgi:hypothetical protein
LGTYDLFRKIAQSSLTEKERDVAQMKNDLLYSFESTPSFYGVTINGVSKKVHLITEKNNKKMLSKPNESFSVGDIVVVPDWNNTTWLVSELDIDCQMQTKGIILECDNVLTFYKSGIVPIPTKIPYVVFDSIALTRMGVDSNKYLTVPNSRMMILIPDTDITRNIERDDIYKLYDSNNIQDNYKVIDINRVRKPGLIILELEHCSEQQVLPTYTINILNGTDLSLILGNTLTLNAEVLADDNIISPTPPLIYESSNDEIATVENGIITSIAVGECTITVSLESDPTVTANIDLSVEEIVEDLFTVDVYGDSTVVLSNNITLEALVYNNGVIDETKGVNWTLSNDDGSSNVYLTIASQDSNSITLTATSDSSYKNKYVTVKGSYTKDGSVFDTHQIKIISLF